MMAGGGKGSCLRRSGKESLELEKKISVGRKQLAPDLSH